VISCSSIPFVQTKELVWLSSVQVLKKFLIFIFDFGKNVLKKSFWSLMLKKISFEKKYFPVSFWF